MATSDTQICNEALGLLTDQRILSILEDRPLARYCRQFFAHCRDLVLRGHTWNFAITRQLLELDATRPAHGFAYRYGLPLDCLRALEIDSESPWVIEGGYLLTDRYPVNLKYITRIEDASQFDSLFVAALRTLLASKLAIAVTGSADVKRQYRRDFEGRMKELAMLADSREKRPIRKPWYRGSLFVEGRRGLPAKYGQAASGADAAPAGSVVGPGGGEGLSQLDVWNLALTEIGQPTIESLTADTDGARACARYFEQSLEEMLREHSWNFAIARDRFARLAQAPLFDWLYQYQLPGDCLRVLWLNSWKEYEESTTWEIEGRRLLTNEKQAEVLYIQRISEITLADTLFTEALIVKLAGHIAHLVTNSRDYGPALAEEYDSLIKNQSQLADAREGRARVKLPWIDSPMIQARRRGYFYGDSSTNSQL